ncbi:sulfite exporter TauE/SafE family protein [Massilia sp. IC2-477]|uniref:sulfite exporter TauE/SafE family protein n=1 Tax=unclassified Massilia TaxID=2609279 RepID=UPI001D106259|nr:MULTISPECIES: sulfite exporter TauE/SafE family protein [unclassified Massilia]MCC2954256.1 sulfite exporter TauE/SafE family protein [Massilia sp. IC2-477]MCC2971695.1 sulfite exporter TauE/SafE family protein [Massilia sp. IC2-476]
MLDVLLNLGLGALLGLVGGLLGIGGGLIAIPVLGLLYGMDQQLAQGTALVMIAPNVLIGFYRYHQKHPVDLRAVASMALFSMVATWFAARFATGLDPRTLHVAFALFLVALALYFGFLSRHVPAAPEKAQAMPRAALPLLGIACGLMSGVFTIGGGLVIVPALVSLFGMQQTRAQGMALALVVPSSLVALFGYAQGGHVDWATGVPLALGGIATVSLGVKLAHRFAPARLRLLFCLVLLGTAATMLLSPR